MSEITFLESDPEGTIRIERPSPLKWSPVILQFHTLLLKLEFRCGHNLRVYFPPPGYNPPQISSFVNPYRLGLLKSHGVLVHQKCSELPMERSKR